MKRKCLFGLVAILVLLVSASALAGWEVTDLHPAGLRSSLALGVSDGQQAGWAWANGTVCAGLWSGAASSWVNLHPGSRYLDSAVLGMSGSSQVGFATDPIIASHAALWTGTAASFVDLNPTGLGGSAAYGVSSGQQVGYVYDYYLTNQASHASLWYGTAASWVDIHPAGYTESRAYGVSDGQQVGYAKTNGANHAGLWRGSAATWIDLNPSGSTASQAWSVSDGWQVGQATLGGFDHASLWNGSASTWLDLHSLLGAGYTKSYAKGIEVSGNDIWVAGYAYNTANGGRPEAILWHNVVPEPSSLLALGSGLLALGGLIRRRR